MKRNKATIIWGVGLLLLGILLLLQNLGVFEQVIDIIWFVLFALAGGVFIGVYLSDRERWWALIPGGAMLGIALLLAVGTLWPRLAGVLGASLFLALIGLSFLAIFVLHRENWWAIIPGGVLFTIAVVVPVGQAATGLETAAVMMLGMAATFGVLSLVETPEGRLRWALIPAAVMFAIGILLLLEAVAWSAFLMAGLLIVVGGYLILRSVMRGQNRRKE